MPPNALAPAVSILLFVFAAAVALIAWLRPMPSRHFSYWDVAGALTFIGICVGGRRARADGASGGRHRSP